MASYKQITRRQRKAVEAMRPGWAVIAGPFFHDCATTGAEERRKCQTAHDEQARGGVPVQVVCHERGAWVLRPKAGLRGGHSDRSRTRSVVPVCNNRFGRAMRKT